jgi:hypothetical protein
MVGPKEDGHGGTRGGDGFLCMHPGVFGYFVPGEPLHAGCLMVLSTAEVNPQSELHRRGALDVFAPGRDSVVMTRGDGNGAVDARCGGSEIEGQFLGSLPTMNIGRVLALVDTIDQRPLASAPVSYWKPRNHAREGHCDHYSTRNQKNKRRPQPN